MPLIMTKDGRVRPMQVSDLKEVADRDERIRQLESRCVELAAEIDTQRPVVETAQFYSHNYKYDVDNKTALKMLRHAVTAYEAAKEQG